MKFSTTGICFAIVFSAYFPLLIFVFEFNHMENAIVTAATVFIAAIFARLIDMPEKKRETITMMAIFLPATGLFVLLRNYASIPIDTGVEFLITVAYFSVVVLCMKVIAKHVDNKKNEPNEGGGPAPPPDAPA